MGKSKSLPLIAVTGSERPYIYDLPNVLSLPAGLEFRFRYRAKWINDALRAQIDAGADLKGRSLHLYFHSTSTERLLPVRDCEVVALERLGPVYFLRFKVRGFVVPPTLPPPPPTATNSDGDTVSTGTTDQEKEKCRDTNELRANCKLCQVSDAMVTASANVFLKGTQLNEELPEYLFVAGASYQTPQWSNIDDKPEAASRSWYDAAAVTSHREADLKGIPLFYLLGFQDERARWVKPSPPWRPTVTLPAAFTLTNGERYRFRLVEWRSDAPPKKTMRVDCVYSPTLLTQEGASSLVVGKYDVPEFTFRAQSVGAGEVAAATQPTDPTPDPDGWPTYYAARVPVRVRQNRVSVAFLALLTITGIALYALPEMNLIDALKTGTWRVLLQFAGLICMFFGSGALVGRFGQMGFGVTRLPPMLSGHPQDAGSGVGAVGGPKP